MFLLNGPGNFPNVIISVEFPNQQTWHIHPMFDKGPGWANVVDGGPALVKHWVGRCVVFAGILDIETYM